MLGGNAAKANQGGQRDPARVVGPSRLLRAARAAERHGHRRRRHRGPLLRGQRVPLPLPDEGRHGRRRRARSTTRCIDFASADPKRLVVIVPGADPRHRLRGRARCERVADAGGKSLQLPVFPAELGLPDYFDERYDPLWDAIPETACRSAATSASTPRSTSSPTATPRRASRGRCRACRCRRARRSACGCSAACSSASPTSRSCSSSPGSAWVAWYLAFIDDMVLRQGYEFPVLDGELPSFYYHRNMAMTFIDEPDPVRHLRHVLGAREHDVVERLPAPGVDVAEVAGGRSRRRSRACPTTSATSWSRATPRASGTSDHETSRGPLRCRRDPGAHRGRRRVELERSVREGLRPGCRHREAHVGGRDRSASRP